jgi:hypothetical protein
MKLDEMIGLAFKTYGNEVINKSYIDQQISSYISVGDLKAEEYSDEDINLMFKRLFEGNEKDFCNM